MRKVILDTSFIVKCAEYHIDLFSELDRILDFAYSIYYFDKTLQELENISTNGKMGVYVRTARLFLRKARRISSASDKYVDDLIVESSSEPGVIVATHDSGLKRRLKTPVIIIRQKRYLVLQSP